jgi:hypothetical protein
MERENIVVTYNLEFQLEAPKRSIELLLAEMTSGIQYVSTREGVRMDPVQDSVPYVDEAVHGETLSVEQLNRSSYRVTYAIPLNNLDVGLGGITNLWPMIAGEVFNFHFIKKATLVEVNCLLKQWKYSRRGGSIL